MRVFVCMCGQLSDNDSAMIIPVKCIQDNTLHYKSFNGDFDKLNHIFKMNVCLDPWKLIMHLEKSFASLRRNEKWKFTCKPYLWFFAEIRVFLWKMKQMIDHSAEVDTDNTNLYRLS